MKHRFQYINDDELQGATPERMATLELIDQCLAETPTPPETLYQLGALHMGDVDLRALLNVYRRINALADQVHADERYSHFTLEELRGMSEPELRALLAGRDPMDWREVAKRAYVAPKHATPKHNGTRYRAVIQRDGRQHHIGYFTDEAKRDEVVNTARGMLALGADLETVLETLRKL